VKFLYYKIIQSSSEIKGKESKIYFRAEKKKFHEEMEQKVESQSLKLLGTCNIWTKHKTKRSITARKKL